jgi:hypothetical protein
MMFNRPLFASGTPQLATIPANTRLSTYPPCSSTYIS